jgi:AbrB family looped-hinge helix DNA binding protein
MRISSKGQVTIPKEVREMMGFKPHSEIEFVTEGDKVYLRKVLGTKSAREKLVERMRCRATVRMSTDEIMALTRAED